MDFLRLHLPGLHQALRGALDSLSTFVSYLIGDEVPTVEREAQATKELEVMAVERPGKTVEEEAQEALEGLRGGQSKGDGKLGGPGEAGRCQGGSSAAEQAWGWGDSSSHGSQTDRQDTGVWEPAKAARCQEPSVPLESGKKSEARSGARQDRSSQAQERQEPEEQEVNRGETLRTWEQEEEEEVRAREPGMARGAESEWTWHRQPEGKAAADGQKVSGDSRETEQVVKETSAGEPERPGAREVGREEEVAVKVRGCRNTSAQGVQSPGEESEDWATSGREEAGTTWGREEAYLPGVRETEYGPVPGERIPEATGSVWVLEEGSQGAQEEEVGEQREAEVSLFPKQAQALGPEAVEEAAEGQTAGREAAGGQEREEEVGECLEGRAAQCGKEAEQAILEDVVQAEEAQEEKGRCWATEAELSPDKEARGDVDLEATTEARPEEEFTGQRSKEAQMSPEAPRVEQGGLQHKVTEGQESEQMGGTQTPTEQPEEGQGSREELWRVPALSKEGTERSLEDYPGHLGCIEPEVSQAFPEAWENQRRRDEERGDTQEEAADGEEEEGEEEVSGVQALEAEATGGQSSELPEILEAGGEGKKAKDRRYKTEVSSVAEPLELNSSPRPEVGTGQSLGESDARETKPGEVEATRPGEADRTSRRDWRLEGAALGLGDRENTQTSALAAEVVENKADLDGRAAGAGAAWEGVPGRSWDSEEREAAAAAQSRGGQEFGLEGSAEEEVVDRGGLAEAFEAGAGEHGVGQAEAGESAEAEGSCGLDHLNLGPHAVRTEGTRATVEAQELLGKQMVLEKEAQGWQAREQREDSEGQHGDCHPEGEVQGPLDEEEILEEEIQVTGGQTEAEEMDPEGLGHIEVQEEPVNQDSAEAAPGPLGNTETAEATGNVGGDACGSWSEALLPGSRLDVSVPRSRVLLSRSSSQRRSRPSFCRKPAPEQQEEPPSPEPEEGLPDPEQSLLQLEEPPEPLRPEGTPVPTRRRPPGHGFGLAHLGMMQELQARLGQPKPQ
ncbi:apolipoprotein B receptor [Microcebus murinus]|uniref:apolipoprotein B receptor n=1 Tax=Microcebus murinus TaxID=30608 RepID=UPI00098A0535|nr:apolipoprotein B receptor [Microcebus murinus]